MTKKLMYIPRDDIQNYPIHKLQLEVETFGHKINEPTYQNSILFPIIVDPTYYKT